MNGSNHDHVVGQRSVETLEGRLYLSASYIIHNHVLKVYGARHLPNYITVSLSHDTNIIKLRDDGFDTIFRGHSIRKVQIFGGTGSDYLAIDQTDHAWIRDVTIVGGGGNDTLIGGDGPDNLYATGTGNAYLQAGQDDSLLVGGNGNDTLDGGLKGNDILVAGTGNQLLIGSTDGYDVIFGGVGNDTLVGGEGGSDLLGYIGNNVIRGTGGMDTIYSGDGVEKIVNEPNSEVHSGIYPAFSKFLAKLDVPPP